jgi:histidinol-phosphatase
MSELDDLLKFAHTLADAADLIAMKYFKTDFQVETKADNTPVSIADREVEAKLRELIAERFPSHGIVGEELEESLGSEWRWILDPIDGTSHYVQRDPGWSSLIALARENQVVVSVASFPAIGFRAWASLGNGAFIDGRQIHVSTVSDISQATLNHTRAGGWLKAGQGDALQRVSAHCLNAEHFSGGLSQIHIAQGVADIAMCINGKLWDYATPRLIVEEAGGTFTDLDGQPRADGRGCLATNGLLHATALELVAQTGLATA